jgi:hypothetical protein
MGEERRVFERENVQIPFIYSIEEGETFSDGEWKEAITVDIGPVLVGGLAFVSEEPFEIGDKIRIALFMDLELKKVWESEPDGFPAIYNGRVCRITDTEEGKKVAVLFRDMEEYSSLGEQEQASEGE